MAVVRDALRCRTPARVVREDHQARLNRGGDRAANSTPHKIAIVRMATDPETRDYVTRRTAEGKTKKDILGSAHETE